MEISKTETIGVTEWINDSSITAASRANRARMLRKFEKANGKNFDQILASITSDATNVYSVCRRFVDSLRNTHYTDWKWVQSEWEAKMFGENAIHRRRFPRNRRTVREKERLARTIT